MSLKEIMDRVEREHPDWTSRQKLDEIDRLRKAEKAERAASRAAAGKLSVPATAADADEEATPTSVAGAWAFLVILVGGMELVGLAVWGDGFDQPDWYNALHGLALIISIRAVYGAYKRRSTGQ